MPHTTVASGFWSGGEQILTPLNGSSGHLAHKMHAVAPEPHAHVAPEEPVSHPEALPENLATPVDPDEDQPVRRAPRAKKA